MQAETISAIYHKTSTINTNPLNANEDTTSLNYTIRNLIDAMLLFSMIIKNMFTSFTSENIKFSSCNNCCKTTYISNYWSFC